MKYYQINLTPAKMPNREFSEWLHESYIDPICNLGFICKTISSTSGEYDGHGQDFHILYFEDLHENHKLQFETMIQNLTTIFTNAEEDSQPIATHRYYLGSLWVFIPYCP